MYDIGFIKAIKMTTGSNFTKCLQDFITFKLSKMIAILYPPANWS